MYLVTRGARSRCVTVETVNPCWTEQSLAEAVCRRAGARKASCFLAPPPDPAGIPFVPRSVLGSSSRGWGRLFKVLDCFYTIDVPPALDLGL